MKTTLNHIREYFPSTKEWKKLLDALGKTKADDEEISIIQILDSNGLDDALCCLGAVKGRDKEIQMFNVWCSRQAQKETPEDLTNARDTFAIAWTASMSAGALAANDNSDDLWATAWIDARDAVRHAQEKELRRICLAIQEGK